MKCERKCAIQQEQQLRMRLEHEEAESRWREQMRALQVKQLEENYVEARNQLKSRRDAAESLLRQLTSIGDLKHLSQLPHLCSLSPGFADEKWQALIAHTHQIS